MGEGEQADFLSKIAQRVSEGERRGVLVIPAFLSVGSLNVHDHEAHILAATHPDAWEMFYTAIPCAIQYKTNRANLL